MQKRIFGPKRDKETENWRKLHDEELNDLYCSPNIILMIKSRKMSWEGHNCVSDNMTDNSCYFPCRNFPIKILTALDELIATKIIRFKIDINVTFTLQFCKMWVAGGDSYYGTSVPLQARGAQRVPVS